MASPDGPGPVDATVLSGQSMHRSEIVSTEGYRPVKFVEHHGALQEWKMEHQGVLQLLRRSAFYHFSRLGSIQLNQALLAMMVERWRPETQSFHLRFGEMTVTLGDVAIITGLQVDGLPVTGPTKVDVQGMCEELLGIAPDPASICGTMVKYRWFFEKFKNIPNNAGEDLVNYATRAYMMYLIGCSMFPHSGGTHVSIKWLHLMRDFDVCGKLAWGAALLANMYRVINNASQQGRRQAHCCARVLQIWAWEHLDIGRPNLGVPHMNHEQPLGCKWAGQLLSRSNSVKAGDYVNYREELDKITEAQVTFAPYTVQVLQLLPPECTGAMSMWRARVLLICFSIVEPHLPDRVMRQFGFLQNIPEPVGPL